MALFDLDKIDEVYEKALGLGFAAKRSVLLAGLDEAYRASLEVGTSPAEQLLLDLRAMNIADRTVGAGIPLQIWLANAALLLKAFPDDEAYFSSLRDQTIAKPTPSPAERQQRAQATLESMQAIAGKNEPLRESLIAANQEFEEIARTVRLLMVYKDVHDVLHEIQVLSLPMFATVLPRGLVKDEDCQLFQWLIADLESKHSRALSEVARLPPESGARVKEERWLEELGNVHRALIAAGEIRSAEAAKDAIVDLRQLLRKKMFLLNDKINGSVEGLRIDVLVEHLRAFAVSLDMQDPRAGQLRDAASNLLALRSEIEALVTSHDGWQRIDEDLWSAEENLVFGEQSAFELHELSRLWPALVDRIARIAGQGNEPWYVQTQQYLEAFREHCPMPATAPIAAAAIGDFNGFLTVTRKQFLSVDKELKTRCDRLVQIAEPVEKLARIQ